jgi:hypothetical protein
MNYLQRTQTLQLNLIKNYLQKWLEPSEEAWGCLDRESNKHREAQALKFR